MKKEILNDIDLYFITDSNLTKNDVIEDVKAAIRGGVKVVQYREKNKSVDEMVQKAKQIKELCGEDVLFIVNDSIEVALASDADGVHVGQKDESYDVARAKLGYNKIVGVSASTIEEALKAEREGANYVGLGPIFPTDTKKDAAEAIGLNGIKEANKKIKIPIVVIGGIHDYNIENVLKAGASKIAMISEIIGSEHVEHEVRKYVRQIRDYSR